MKGRMEENGVDEEGNVTLLLVNKKNIEDVHSQSSLQNTHHGDGQSDEWQDSIEGDCIKAQPDGVFILRGFPWNTQVPLHYTKDRNGYLERSFDTSLHFYGQIDDLLHSSNFPGGRLIEIEERNDERQERGQWKAQEKDCQCDGKLANFFSIIFSVVSDHMDHGDKTWDPAAGQYEVAVKRSIVLAQQFEPKQEISDDV